MEEAGDFSEEKVDVEEEEEDMVDVEAVTHQPSQVESTDCVTH